jgi:glyoxylase-like metal-dependent hydrolase (beta-lactamase superfamily II)
MTARVIDWGADERRLTDAVSVLVGADQGAYPTGNSVVVRGAAEAVIIDPSVSVVDRGGAPVAVDAVINSHGHEDHLAGNALFDRARVHIHDDDLMAARSLDGLMAVYGYEGDVDAQFRQQILDDFHYGARPDAIGFREGHVWDLGGTTVEAVHLPGHTRGHSGFRIDGGRVFFLSDIDLTGFGPYYGDVWSDLDDFEDSLLRVREEHSEHYVTFHHKGVIDGRDTFVKMLDDFHAVIGRRHRAMLEYLTEPRTLEEMAAHRFVYRPHVQITFADAVERRTAELHVARMVARGEASEVEPGRYQRT